MGGKEFRFTSSHEMGGLCDIYEERRSGEGGNGLLVESGCAWRKLNVQRVLDESTKNHVKMLSEEAERKLKSRKAIVLDQCNPTMKSQMKALAAAEASPWKFKHKKDLQFKKRNFEPSQVGAPPKNLNKSGSSSNSIAKGAHSASPLPSSPHQSISLASPSMRGNITDSKAIAEDTTPVQVRTKENAVNSENDFTALASSRTGTMDLQKLLITLLKESPKGMSLKALEKAVEDVAPSSARKIDPILKKIATYEPPRKYILKPGVELDSLKPSDDGSSPEDNHQKQYAQEDNHGSAPDLGFVGKSPDLEEQEPMNNKFEEEPNLVEKNDASIDISNLFGDDDPPENSERQTASSSDSGSDTDSDSDSDRSSDSGSRSRSRSPGGTASGSGSDSENGSDVDIDILNDDDKEPKKLQDAEHGLSTKPNPWSMPESRPVQDGTVGDQDGYVSEDIDIEKDFLDDNEAELATAPHDPAISTQKLKTVSPDLGQSQPYSKSKRGSDVIQTEENVEHVKRFKAASMAQSSMSGYTGSSPLRPSPDVTNGDRPENHNLQMQHKFIRDDNSNSNSGMQRVYNHPLPGKAAAELPQSLQRSTGAHNLGEDVKYQEGNSHSREGFLKQGDKGRKGTQDEEGSSNKKVNGKFKEVGLDKKQLGRPERNHKKHSEDGKKSTLASSPKDRTDSDRSPVDRRRLQRELSDLELGELREPLPEEPEVPRKQFDRVGSFKQSETKFGTPASWNSDMKGKTGSKPTLDPGNQKNSDSWPKRRSPEPYVEETLRPSNGGVQSQQQQSRVARAEISSLPNKAADLSRPRQGLTDQGTDVEGYGETQKKSHGSTQPEDSTKQDLGSRKVKGNKSRRSNTLVGATDRRDISLIEGPNDKRKRSESSSDENSSYSKYEKEEPELKGPIKSFSQYKEYVQEYQEKYECYCSLNRVLESYRNDFQKLGMELDSSKGRDMESYYNILAQLRESYRQCGTRHKRLKKIFVVLHEELKHLKQRIKDFAEEYMRD